jgi:hypothetical protein
MRGFYGKEYSERYGEKIDDEVKRIMDEAWNRARMIITDKRAALTSIAEEPRRDLAARRSKPSVRNVTAQFFAFRAFGGLYIDRTLGQNRVL